MSAAVPGPPPSSSHGQTNNSLNNTDRAISASRERVLAHISDLQAEALTGFNPTSSIKALVITAEDGLSSANANVQFRRPDRAFVEYMRAHEITTNVIPRHKAYIDFIHDDKNGEHKLKVLRGKLFAAHEQFMNIKMIIENDNQRNGTLSAGSMSNGYVAAREKPTPGPKPQSMHGHATLTMTTTTTTAGGGMSQDLENRFSRLRLNTAAVPIGEDGSRPSTASTIQATPVDMHNGAPLRPAKVPLDGPAMSLPKPPSPTYSPARNMALNGSIAPPRHSARSLASSDVRRVSSQPQSAPATGNVNGADDSSFPPPINGAILGSAPRRRRSTALDDVEITADRLYDYLARFSVLLIDVRPRQEYDQGHVFARNILCVEPMTLRQGMSAEQLHESLVISPDKEQSLWEDRHMFDLVVYYDQDSREPSEPLRVLHEALWEFNQEKPLKAVPKLLTGGLDAWCDIAGSQSLMVSSTVSRQGHLQRRPLATSSGRSELRVPKRRLRDYNPLDKDEERTWLERARQESVSAPKPPILAEDDGIDDSGNAAIEAFLQRFPDAGLIDRQTRIPSAQLPPRQPSAPPKVLEYPSRPTSSHQVPTRPAPAAPRMSYNGVSDRAAPPLARTSSMTPYVPPKYNPINLRLPRTGLVNFGVTCYMNATLQALSATVPLSVFFLDDSFRRSVQRDNWKGSKGVMPELYSTLVRSLWAGDVEAIKPSTFRNFCGRLNREWSIDRQQDAKEFFDFLVDCLHEDLNSEWSRQPFRVLTEAEEQRREAMPKGVVSKVEWDRYTHREKSLLTQLFAGQHASKLKCTTCGFTSTTYEAFYSLSVEIPPRAGVTLDECLRSYCAEEMLSGDEVWKCPHCRREREATKQITLTRAPQFLVVHFKRFASGQGGTRKVRTPIEFPLQGLDLEPYMLPPTPPDVLEKYSKQMDFRALQSDLSTRPPYIYDAYAVMRHIGSTLTSGHYTCAVKDRARGSWRMFNDTRVNDFQPDQLGRSVALNNEEAYIVFYQRRV